MNQDVGQKIPIPTRIGLCYNWYALHLITSPIVQVQPNLFSLESATDQCGKQDHICVVRRIQERGQLLLSRATKNMKETVSPALVDPQNDSRHNAPAGSGCSNIQVQPCTTLVVTVEARELVSMKNEFRFPSLAIVLVKPTNFMRLPKY